MSEQTTSKLPRLRRRSRTAQLSPPSPEVGPIVGPTDQNNACSLRDAAQEVLDTWRPPQGAVSFASSTHGCQGRCRRGDFLCVSPVPRIVPSHAWMLGCLISPTPSHWTCFPAAAWPSCHPRPAFAPANSGNIQRTYSIRSWVRALNTPAFVLCHRLALPFRLSSPARRSSLAPKKTQRSPCPAFL